MADEIDNRVSADLHPDTFLLLDGVDDSTVAVIAPAMDAFDAAYKFIASVHDVRAAAFADPELTPEGALLKTDAFASQRLATVTKRFDSTVAQFDRSIASIEADLSGPVKAQASQMISGEVRAMVKAQTADKRGKMIEQAFVDGDDEVLSAICGAPPMLSGLSKEMHAFYLRRYHEMKKPEASKRLKALTAAKAHLEARAPVVFSGMLNAVGTIAIPNKHGGPMRHVTAQEVRAKKDASAKVYARHS